LIVIELLKKIASEWFVGVTIPCRSSQLSIQWVSWDHYVYDTPPT